MAPHGPRSMAVPPTGPARSSAMPPVNNGAGPTPPTPGREEERHAPAKGPHPGKITLPKQYCNEQRLRGMQLAIGCDPSRETSYRLQGIQLIDSVRLALRLPIKTFDTACTYYHMFRLFFRDAEYNFQDAALTALFVACKVEDTMKKSKEILCAAYNLKNPDHPTTPDDKMFEQPTRIVIGLERHILQTVGFDFRVRHPQKYLIKVVRKLFPTELGKQILDVAYPMCTDMYKTFAPIKQATFTMVMAIVELTARLTGHQDFLNDVDLSKYHTDRGSVVETMLDLLDLYAQFLRQTKVGMRFDLDTFIQVKIKINQEVEADPSLERFMDVCTKCSAEEGRDGAQNNHILSITPGSATSPATTGSGGAPASGGKVTSAGKGIKSQDGTLRYAFDSEQVRAEKRIVDKFFEEKFEEYEVEVEEEIPETSHQNSNHRHNHHHNPRPPTGPAGPQRGHGSRRDRGGHHDGASTLLTQKAQLATGATIPRIQLGLYMMSRSEASRSVRWALEAGYRGFDCAQMYRNEAEAGAAIREAIDGGGLAREDVFYTTKLASNSESYDAVRRSIRKSVDACGLGYVDLFLLHSPYGGCEARLTSWRAVEVAIDDGEVKMGGVSNYGVKHIEELMASKPRHHPVINQIEVHPFNTQVSIREACASHKIVIEAYAPLARAMRMKDPTMVSLSKKYGCTVAQLFVKWSLQNDFVTLPKSSKRERIVENVDVGGFEISQQDMEKMNGLDEKLVTDCLPPSEWRMVRAVAESRVSLRQLYGAGVLRLTLTTQSCAGRADRVGHRRPGPYRFDWRRAPCSWCFLAETRGTAAAAAALRC
ncbi:hypothetical protein PspLS_05880 [Pyricularia sp. CBS 133598]|nr:hypothetical protein PspLS_05880 [Pyricularia sp. CBS 133598]